jgi:predicted peroxiredoxin
MAKYLLIESRDPYEFADADYFYDVAADLSRAGNEVAFFLIQNGVLVSRRGAQGHKLSALQQDGAGIQVLADEFSLRERGIGAGDVASGVQVSGIDTLVDLLVDDGRKAVWH